VHDLILPEIRRLALESGGRPPGEQAFTKATGITKGKWYGVFWARWGDALIEAGFEPNTWTQRSDSAEMLSKVAELCRQLGRLPIDAELRMRRKIDPEFPRAGTLFSHFSNRAGLVAALRKLADADGYDDLLPMLARQWGMVPPFR
jgi:hypothetical protein